MDMERSRNNFYTVTFINKKNLDEDSILQNFNSVGEVIRILQSNNRVFVRYRDKAEAQRAILKFEKVFHVEMAKPFQKNNEQQSERNSVKSPVNSHVDSPPSKTHSVENSSQNMVSSKCTNLFDNGFHLILGNLPKNYTINDVRSLVVEVNPLCINELEETKAFCVKFCHIVLDTAESLTYLINKLDGFVIGGEKLIALEAKNLLEWRSRQI